MTSCSRLESSPRRILLHSFREHQLPLRSLLDSVVQLGVVSAAKPLLLLFVDWADTTRVPGGLGDAVGPVHGWLHDHAVPGAGGWVPAFATGEADVV